MLATAPAAGGPLGADLPRLPLDPPIRLTSGYGETRALTFHAGLDFATGGRVGAPVYAPLGGWIERVRASGSGYGRSVYLRTDDGRLLVFGHLDAFAPELAAYVDSVQRATGEYEQDLWPWRGRFSVRAGQRIAWSGESGAGAPHLHFEIRREDFALNPLRAGATIPDALGPRLVSLALEPLDDASWVARRVAPVVRTLGARPETLLVEGRVRAAVGAVDPGSGGTRTPPWSVAMTWAGRTIEARFDSISWDGDMSEVDAVFDRGRIADSQGLVLYAPRGWRPRVIRTDLPDSLAAGVIEVRPGDPPRPLELVARDAAGQGTRRLVWLRGPGPAERGPDRTGPAARSRSADARPPVWHFASLPEHFLRASVQGAPIGLRDVRIFRDRGDDRQEGTPATFGPRGWSVVLSMIGVPDGEGFWIKGRLADGKPWLSRGSFVAWPAGTDLFIEPSRLANLSLPTIAVFEEGVLLTDFLPAATSPGPGLRALTTTLRIAPAEWPLRKPLSIRLRLPEGMAWHAVGLYRHDPDGWTWLRASFDSTSSSRLLTADSRTLGEFALMRDEAAPVAALRPVRTHAAAGGPYPRWQIEAHARDEGSGIDGRASFLRVDGVRVPTEWDGEQGILRWRPLVRPAAGAHELEIVVQDRAGNSAVRRERFVLDSRPR